MAFTLSGDAATTRTNLGLGDAATKTTGTASGNIPVLDSSGQIADAQLAALSVSKLTGVGTSGQVLTSTGTTTAPTMQDAAGGGKLLQLVSTSSSASLYADGSWRTMPGADLSITPLAAGSKFLISYYSPGAQSITGASTQVRLLDNGGTAIWQSDRYGESSAGGWEASPFALNAVHTGASYTVGTPITYAAQAKENAGGIEINVSGTASATMQIMEIGA